MSDTRSLNYNHEFYVNRRNATLHAARTILSYVFDYLGDVKSVVDYGCGRGTWLSVAEELGAKDIHGFEGHWLNRSEADVASNNITLVDLEEPTPVSRRFDLAVSLEVAEHLSPDRAASFVSDLCEASDYVLFSAAIPNQGGTHHINERWQSYWASLFAENGYGPIDCVRPKIWNSNEIPCWYRQNIILYSNKVHSHPDAAPALGNFFPLDVVHPELFDLVANRQRPNMTQALSNTIKSNIKQHPRLYKWALSGRKMLTRQNY